MEIFRNKQQLFSYRWDGPMIRLIPTADWEHRRLILPAHASSSGKPFCRSEPFRSEGLCSGDEAKLTRTLLMLSRGFDQETESVLAIELQVGGTGFEPVTP